MQKKRRNGRASTETSFEDEIAHLRGLDSRGLRARWQSVFQRPAPAHLTRHLLFAIIAYRIQADRFGDLDHETRQVLDRTVAKEARPVTSARLASFDQKRTELSPGTVLVREWDRQSQRVMVMADGFAWNGLTASPRSPSPSPAPSGTVRASSAFGIKKIDRRWRLCHEDSFRQIGPLRDLYEGLHRAGARSGIQLIGCPVRCCLGLYQESGPCGLDPDPVPVR